MKGFEFIVIFILLSSSVLSLGLGPVEVFKAYQPGRMDRIELTVFNNEKKDESIDVSVRGDLKDYIEFNRTLTLRKDQDQAKIIFYLTHPSGLKGGAHISKLVITERSSKESTVSAVQSYSTKLTLQAPLDEQYAEARLNIVPGSTTDFNIDVFNYGKDDITVSAKILVYKDDILLQELSTDKKDVASLKQETIKASAVLSDGKYHTMAIVDYGKTIKLEDDFVVGRPKIEIVDVYADRFMPYEVAKIHINLKTDWQEPINGVRGEILIRQGNNIIDKIDTETFTLFEEKEVLAFWENKGSGNYSARLNIIYGDSTVSKDFYLITGSKNNIFFMIMLIVLLLIIIAEIIREKNHGGPVIKFFRSLGRKTKDFYSKII